jgi:hypothetical protein
VLACALSTSLAPCSAAANALARSPAGWNSRWNATGASRMGVLTFALRDSLLPHAETVPIEGRSWRTKDQIEA